MRLELFLRYVKCIFVILKLKNIKKSKNCFCMKLKKRSVITLLCSFEKLFAREAFRNALVSGKRVEVRTEKQDLGA